MNLAKKNVVVQIDWNLFASSINSALGLRLQLLKESLTHHVKGISITGGTCSHQKLGTCPDIQAPSYRKCSVCRQHTPEELPLFSCQNTALNLPASTSALEQSSHDSLLLALAAAILFHTNALLACQVQSVELFLYRRQQK